MGWRSSLLPPQPVSEIFIRQKMVQILKYTLVVKLVEINHDGSTNFLSCVLDSGR